MKNRSLLQRRYIAQILDILFYYSISFIVGFIFSLPFTITYNSSDNPDIKIYRIAIVLFIIFFLTTYVILNYISGRKGQTVGYKILNIKISRYSKANNSSEIISKSIVFKRLFLKIPYYFLNLILIGLLFHIYLLYKSRGRKDLLDYFLNTEANSLN
jgi:hypothetical protein